MLNIIFIMDVATYILYKYVHSIAIINDKISEFNPLALFTGSHQKNQRKKHYNNQTPSTIRFQLVWKKKKKKTLTIDAQVATS